MAISVYKCDTCKREIELTRNVKGLETVGHCIITHGCRGSLFQTELHPDYVRGSIPDPVVGLDDWKQRKVLHNHVQSIQRTEWVIEHNMGVLPTVSVFVNRPLENNLKNQEEIIPIDIIAIDDNILKLVFDRAWAGNAQLVSKQSDPNLLKPKIRVTTKTADTYQLSNLGEITIATKATSPYISLLIKFISSTGQEFEHEFSIDNQPSINSPWQDAGRVIINSNSVRQPFQVRSFSGITNDIRSGNITSGSTFTIIAIDESGTGANFRNIKKGDVLILLASAPYDIIDKIIDKYIDVYNVSDINNPFGFFYNNGEFFATAPTVTPVFPTILSIDN